MAVLMPIRSPLASTSAPPELPGLIAASVWMKFSKVLMPRCVRPRPLTMPCVTVCPTPNGLPMASTTSPDAHLVRPAEGDGGKVLQVDFQHCQVALGIGADERRLCFGGRRSARLDLVGAVDHVVIGENVALRAHDHARPEAGGRCVSPSN